MNATPSARDQIVTTAAALFEMQGYAATGLNQIVREAGAPKGSLYHYFPGGKDELAIEALRLLGQRTEERLRATLALADDPGAAVGAWARVLAARLRDSGYRGAGSIAAIALETSATSPELNAVCREVYRLWQDAYRDALSRFGFAAASAEGVAGFVLAAIEGALLLCRVRRTTQPLEEVAEDLDLFLGRRSYAEPRPAPAAAYAPAEVPLAVEPPAPAAVRPLEGTPASAPAVAPAVAGANPGPPERAAAPAAPPGPAVLRADDGPAHAQAPEEPPARLKARRPLRLLVLGASGGTGSHLIEQALAAGHAVTAVARDPASIWVKHERLAVVKGDVRDAERMDEIVAAGIDAVLSAVGPTQGAPRNLLTVGMQNLVAAMEHHGVRRLVVLMSAALSDPHDEVTLSRSVGLTLRRLAPGSALDDAEAAAAVLRASALDWTIVRAPRLTDGPRTSFYLTGYLKVGSGHSIARGDVAEFMLRQITDSEYLHAAPLISY